jgi:hypothetical protein
MLPHLSQPIVIRGPSREKAPTAATSPPTLVKAVGLNSTNQLLVSIQLIMPEPNNHIFSSLVRCQFGVVVD